MVDFANENVLVAAGTVVTATGSATGVEVDDKDEFRGQSIVSAVSGTTPSITVSIQTSYDNGVTDAWRTIASFTAQTAANTSAHQSFAGLDRWVRASWVVSGTTPSVTFGVAGEIL